VTTPLFESSLRSLTLLGRGKVRDIYAIDADKLLIVTSDRLSAFDVILPDPIPRKGEVLTAMANFWFARLGHIVPNQLTGIAPRAWWPPTSRIRCAAARWSSSASPRCPSRPSCAAT
jgi:phosphoribosylaminoimidazole-succinocarboxamide synthase